MNIICEKYNNDIVLVALRSLTSDDMIILFNMFMNRNDKLFSFVNSDDEVTIFYDNSLTDLSFNNYIHKGFYVGYRCNNTGSFVDISGLVKSVSSMFSDNNIPIMYMTTFNNDYVIIPKEYENQADNIIKDIGVDIESYITRISS